MNSSRRFAQLDALRAFAVGIVMVHHFCTHPFFLSGFGSILFLVLSGYFATKSLIRLRGEAEAGLLDRPAALKSFYFQRVLRLFPLYYLVLLVTLLCGVKSAHASFFWNAAFLSNFRMLWTGEWDGRFSPLWSLSLLEQFYLVWPAVILFCPKPRLLPVVFLTILVAPVYRLFCLGFSLGPIYWCVAPFASFDQLGCGALLAICTSRLFDPWLGRRLLAFAGSVCLPLFGVILACKALGYNPPGCALYVSTVGSLAFIWLINRAETGFTGPVGAFLENPTLGYVGRLSYSVFLLHTFSSLLVPRWHFLNPLMNSDLRLLVLIPVSLLIAHLAYLLVESPIQRFRRGLLANSEELAKPLFASPTSALAE